MSILYIYLLAIWILNHCSAQSGQKYAPDQLVVKFKQDVELDLRNLFSSKGFGYEKLIPVRNSFPISHVSKTGNKGEARTYLIRFTRSTSIEKAVTIFLETDLFQYVEPNYIGEVGGKSACPPPTFPNDTHFKRQWSLYNDGSFTLSAANVDADIDMELAWDIEQGSEDIVVAILDTGIKNNHPDFNGRMWTNTNESPDGIDNDNNGYADDLNGWDFANNDNSPIDDYRHGTNLAGIVDAMPDNGIGYAGVDWNCRIMNCKILNENNCGYYSWWTEAIYYAVDNGADVINMPVGGASFSSIMRDAVNYAFDNGVVIVASMMNFNNSTEYYPAAYLNPIAVGSTDANDQRSGLYLWEPSSRSIYTPYIDIMAPGK